MTDTPAPQPPQVVSHSEAIKALTHPLRIRLLKLLENNAELTATQCAQLTGESVASCSYHLRQLEKYGHVTRAQSTTKERPWRATTTAYRVQPDPEDPESVHAAQAFGSLWLTEQFTHIQRWLADVDRDDPEWALAGGQTALEFWATQAELTEVTQQLTQLTNRFHERNTDPSKRPPGARKAHLFGATWTQIPDADTE